MIAMIFAVAIDSMPPMKSPSILMPKSETVFDTVWVSPVNYPAQKGYVLVRRKERIAGPAQ